MSQRTIRFSSEPLPEFWGLNSRNPPPMEPPKSASNVLHTRPLSLEACHRHPRPAGRQVLLSSTRLLWPSSWLGQYGHSYVHLHLWMSKMSVTATSHSTFWSLGLSLTSILRRSRSIGTARPYLAFSWRLTTISKLHTYTSQVKRNVA